MKNTIFILVFFCLSQTLIQAQKQVDSLSLKIQINFGNKAIVLGEKYISKKQDTLKFDELKFYLSSFEICYFEDTIFSRNNNYFLMDIDKPETLDVKLKLDTNKLIKSLKFNIGVDSLANVSGALKGDLDPVNGMYWAWQSGYINMKIEGKSNSCKTRNNKFQFHIGGYLKPNYAMREIEIPINKFQEPKLKLIMDFDKLFELIDLKSSNSIMIPGKNAMQIADYSTTIFRLE
jgi:hypothetical protein